MFSLNALCIDAPCKHNFAPVSDPVSSTELMSYKGT